MSKSATTTNNSGNSATSKEGALLSLMLEGLFSGLQSLEVEKRNANSGFGFEATGAELAAILRERAAAYETKAKAVSKAPSRLSKTKAKNPYADEDIDDRGVDKNHALRIVWDNHEKQRLDDDKRQEQRSRLEAAQRLRVLACRDLWAADHLVADRHYILRPDEIAQLFPEMPFFPAYGVAVAALAA